jgi:hypothetical protein
VAAASDDSELDLTPSGLDITDGDYEFLRHIGELLSPSPRAIKRFVNTYRLINGVLAQEGHKDSGRLPADSEIRMLLLAVFVGMPSLSRRVQHTLRKWGGSDTSTTWVELMERSQREQAPSGARAWSQERARVEWATVRQWLEGRGGPWSTLPATRVAEWLETVGRYTFNLTRTPAERATPAARTETKATRRLRRPAEARGENTV